MKRLAAALAAVTLIRLVVAATAPLAPDEAYYWIWSHALAPGYLDHPPMVALWIKAGTALVGQTALGVRLLGPLAAALASWMLFDTARVLFKRHAAGVAAATLLNASLLLGVGTVVITPDSPLLFFWTAALWAMARLLAGGSATWWLAAGVFGGLALASKYTALLLWVGIGLWTLAIPEVRPWLRRWQPWAACAIGLMVFAPVVAWNADHDWAGLARQGGRIDDWRPARAFGFLAELVGGQIGLATPLVWILCMAGLVVAVRRAWSYRDPAWSLLAALSLPPVVVFVQHAIGDRVQGNWPAIIYPALTVAVGGLIGPDAASAGTRRGLGWRGLGWRGLGRQAAPRNTLTDLANRTAAIPTRWWVGAAALGFGITALAYGQATMELIPLPTRLDPVAMRLAGWDDLARQIDLSGKDSVPAYIAADGYGLASELAWWLPAGPPVFGTDTRWTLTTLPTVSIAGMSGLLVRDARRADPPDPRRWADIRQISRATRPGSSFDVYLVKAAGIATEMVELPHRLTSVLPMRPGTSDVGRPAGP